MRTRLLCPSRFFLGEHATTFSFPVGTHTETNYVQGTPDPVVEHIAPLSTEHDGIVSVSGCMPHKPVIEHVTSGDGIFGGAGLVTSLLSDGCVEAPATPVMGRSHHNQAKSEGRDGGAVDFFLKLSLMLLPRPCLCRQRWLRLLGILLQCPFHLKRMLDPVLALLISQFLAPALEAHGDTDAETGTDSGGRSLGDFHVVQEGQQVVLHFAIHQTHAKSPSRLPQRQKAHRTAQRNLLQLARDLLQRFSHATRRSTAQSFRWGTVRHRA